MPAELEVSMLDALGDEIDFVNGDPEYVANRVVLFAETMVRNGVPFRVEVTNVQCARCGVDIHYAGKSETDGTPFYGGNRNCVYTCSDHHGHDEKGIFAPNHDMSDERVKQDDDKYFIAFDGTDACRYDNDSEEWVIPNNPFTP